MHWHNHFVLYSGLHGFTVLLFGALWAVLIAIGIRLRRSAWEIDWRRGMGGGVAIGWLWANAVQLVPPYFSVADSLPVQLCDIAGVVLPFALWLRLRLLQAVIYFWGGSFSLLAILTPDLRSGMDSVGFWTFWIPHANLTGAACYVAIVDGFRPRWADCARIYAITVLYLMIILSFDIVTGFNYGYVGSDRPEQPWVMVYLGPWPWRILPMTLLAAAAFVLLQLPWLSRMRGRQSAVEYEGSR